SASYANTTSTPGGCVVRKAFQTPTCLLSRPPLPARDRNSARVQISSWPPSHRAKLGRPQNLSCPFAQQTRGHEKQRKMAINNKIAAGILRIFHETGFQVRKPCIAGTGRENCNITTTKLLLVTGNGDAGAGG